MKPTALYSAISIFLISIISACNSCADDEPRYEVMKRYGGWQARMDATRNKVKYIEDNFRQFTRYEFDSLDQKTFSTEYPYWESVYVHLDETGVKRVRIFSQPEKGYRWEKLYFNEGRLIYACSAEGNAAVAEKPQQEYFFEEKTLVFALDSMGEKRDIKDDKVLMAGIDFINEARQITEIIANKIVKP